MLGLRWDAIDFESNTITIKHTVTSFSIDGKKVQVAQDTTKTKASMRTLPLVPQFKEHLLLLKAQQDEYRRVCGRCYNQEYSSKLSSAAAMMSGLSEALEVIR